MRAEMEQAKEGMRKGKGKVRRGHETQEEMEPKEWEGEGI